MTSSPMRCFLRSALSFLENRCNASAFEPVPTGKEQAPREAGVPEVYTVEVNGKSFVVQVNEGGDIEGIKAVGSGSAAPSTVASAPASGTGEPQPAPLAGNIFKVLVQPGQLVQEGDLVIILEAMKMETEIRAFKAGTVSGVNVKVGDAVSVGDSLLTIA